MNGLERLVGCMEIERIVKSDEPDEVDRLLEKNGVLYNSESDIDYQKNYGDDEGSEDEKND